MTIVGGVFLAFNFILPKMGIHLPFEPAWITVIICGISLLYLAVWRIIHNKGISKISSALLISIAIIAADRIIQNDILRVLPGEAIPVDGIIIHGETSVDQSIMTGESMPVDKNIGDEVFCGTINRFGSIDIKATNVGEDCSLQKLIRMMQDAENNQAPMQRIADKCASWLVPAAMIIAIIAGLVTQDIVRAVTVLVVFCPCALVLATPTAIMAAIGQATKHGIVIKSGEALEKMGKVNTIVFDKTGTLTYGKLELSDIISLDKNISENDLLVLAASAEARSEHPLGKAVVAYARNNGIILKKTDFFKMQGGKGIRAELSGLKLYCGNEKFIRQNGIMIPANATNELDKLRMQGKASIIVADSRHCIGILALSDVLRPTARVIINKLSEMKTETVLLTGDNKKTADYFAAQAGITNVKADLLPDEKVQSIAHIQEAGNTVCMIGDGVNDAPALKTADVGVAMGSMGSDIAVEAADIALMNDDISNIPYLKRLSNATVATIKFSISLSMCINLAAVTCSVLGLLNPTTGALVHNAGSCFVVLIAALLYDRNFE